MPRIIDNEDAFLGRELGKTLGKADALDACVGYLNLRGWSEIREAVDGLQGLPDRAPAHVLIGMAARPEQMMRRRYRIRGSDEDDSITNKEAIRLRDEAVREFREQLSVGVPSRKVEDGLRNLRRQLVEGKVRIKFFARYPLHAKLYLAHLNDDLHVVPRQSFVGSSNLTFSGLAGQGELNIDESDVDATEKLEAWFLERWEDKFSIDVTDDLIKVLDESWVTEEQPDPYLIYLKLAYELSSDAREGLRDYDIPASLKNVLMPHQADAVRVAARIVEKRGGVMVGDVVGLGKTLIATAVARVMFEQHSTETLVVCPKNLVPMWKDYLREYQIVGDVISLSMAHVELTDLARYRLVVIDESHNLRNTETRQWEAVHSYIERNDPWVVLLTATPYNKAFTDAAGQLRLWLNGDTDLGVRPEHLIEAVGELEVASKADGRLSTLQAFESSESPEDWQRLMSLFLVRRTRSFIEARYGTKDAEGRTFLSFADGTPFYFPERKPMPLEYEGGPDDPGDRLASPDTVDRLNSLSLPRYRLRDFIDQDITVEEPADEKVIERLERSRGNLMGFIRTTLMKRLSSCGQSFMVSVERHLLRSHVALHAVDHGLRLPIGTVEDRRWEGLSDLGDDSIDGLEVDHGSAVGRKPEEWAEVAASRFEALANKPPASLLWLDSGYFTPDLRDALVADIEVLQGILNENGPWDPETDSKIAALVNLIGVEHPGEKVLVFSEYADTAEYVSEQLKARLGSAEVAVATGQSANPTRLARRFSPKSNAQIGGLPSGEKELQVLVATDVLSEGQNLQDAAIVVNFDLPWTIIRLVQRAGRVDRVGQSSPEVLVYSFLPQSGVEAVIALRERIRVRLKENAEVFGSDERFFEDEIKSDQLEGLFDGTANLDEDETDEDVDWASKALAIWEEASEPDRDLTLALPSVAYSTRRRRDDEEQPGCLVYSRTRHGIDGLAFAGAALGAESTKPRLITPYEALSIAEVPSGQKAELRRPDHHELVADAVSNALFEAAKRPLSITRSGPRARLYKLMNGYRETNKGTFFDTPELRSLIDRVFHTPLQETAKQRVAKALRERQPDDVVALAIDLDEQDALLVDMDDSDDEIGIVCSLGIPDAS